MRLYALSEIAALICEADHLTLGDNELKYSQVRNIARRGLLRNGVQVDRRGTQAFPLLEVYRARILTTLADFSMDVAEFGDLDHAEKRYHHVLPSRCLGIWHGLRSIIDGVRAGETWSLVIKHYAPSVGRRKAFTTAFVWEGDEQLSTDEQQTIDDSFGTGSARGTLTLDLNALFAGLPEVSE